MNLQKLDTAAFDRTVYEQENPCLVIFMRKECHVCKDVIPVLEEMEPGCRDVCSFYAVDIEEQEKLFRRFPLKSVPQILFFKEGEYQGKMGGLVEEEDVEEKIAELFG